MFRPLTPGLRNSKDNQRDLLVKLKNGSHTAFTALYDQYKIQLTANLLRLLRSRELVEEVIQDLFMGVWEHRKRIDPDQPIQAYLFQIAANKVKNIYRKAANERKMRELFLPQLQTEYSHIEEAIFKAENRELLTQLLSQLSPQQYRVYTLCKLEGKTYKEVSELLQISETTVNAHIRDANRILKSKITRDPNATLMLLLAYSIQFLH